MNKILPIVYTIATILIIIGALFILQGEDYGLAVLSLGLLLNVIYRFSTLNYVNVKSLKIMDVLRLANILFMVVACFGFLTNWDDKFNLLILTIVLDLLFNLKEISFKTK